MSPRFCAVCGARLSAAEALVCASCHLHLPLTGFEAKPEDNPMARLFWGLFPIERASALFYYEPKSASTQLIYDLKYHHRPETGQALGVMLARSVAATGFFNDVDALVPVPLTRWRRWQRGYNQSLEIARGVAQETGLGILTGVVKRVRFDGSQTRKHAWQRRQSVAAAFRLARPEKAAGKHLLLIDDVVTTGATIAACATQLALAGNVRFSVLSAAFTRT